MHVIMYMFIHTSVPVIQAALTNHRRLAGLNGNLFLTVLETGSPGSWRQHGQVPMSPFLGCRRLASCVFSQGKRRTR